MKTSLFIGFIMLTLFFACQETENYSLDRDDATFDRPVLFDFSKAGAQITPQRAKELTSDFTETYQGMSYDYYSNSILKELLKDPAVYGLRFYVGSSGEPRLNDVSGCLVILPVDISGLTIMELPVTHGESGGPDAKRLRNIYNAGKKITLEECAGLTDNFMHNYKGVYAMMFSRSIIEQAMNTPGTAGLKFYIGSYKNGALKKGASGCLVIVPVDQSGENIAEVDFNESFPCTTPDCK